jgi:uncharacterized protein
MSRTATVNIDIRLELLADKHEKIQEYLVALKTVQSTGDLELTDRFMNNKVLESNLRKWTSETLLSVLQGDERDQVEIVPFDEYFHAM